MILWLVGMSGAGKTAIGRELCALWKQDKPNTVLVDGDEMRAVFMQNDQPDAHTIAGRRRNAERVTEVCNWLDRQDMNVVCCILSIFPEMRQLNRERFSGYREIYVRVPQEELERRDNKGLYAAVRRGEITDVVGFDIAFPEPTDMDLVIDNFGPDMTPRKAAQRIMSMLKDSS